MPTDTTIVRPTAPLFDEARLAIAGFLARYSRRHPDQLRHRPAQDLQPDVYWNGEFLSPAAFREQVAERGLCGTSGVSFSGLRSFFVVLSASVAVVLTVAAGGAILIWSRRRRAPVDL